MAIAEATVPRFEMGRVLKRTFSVVGNNFLAFALFSLVVAIPYGLLSWISLQFPAGLFRGNFQSGFNSTSDGLYLLSQIVFYVGSFVLQAAGIHATVVYLNGRKVNALQSFSTALGLIVPLVGLGVLATLGIFGGFLLLIVPGIILAIMWSVAVPAFVVENTGVMGAFRRSRDLTSGYRGSIFVLMLAFAVIVILGAVVLVIFVGIIVVAVMPDIEAPGEAETEILVDVIAGTIGAILNSALAASIYYELRQMKDGIGPEELASVFD